MSAGDKSLKNSGLASPRVTDLEGKNNQNIEMKPDLRNFYPHNSQYPEFGLD